MITISEHLVHTAVLRDSMLLMERLNDVDNDLKALMRRYSTFAQLGCVTVSGDVFSYKLLQQFKEDTRKKDPYREAKIAFLMGWISHRACDRVMKVIWKEAQFKGRGTDVDPNISPYECSIYHEAEAFKLYFEHEEDYLLALFPDEMQHYAGECQIDQERAYAMVQGAFAANLLNIQTIPDNLNDQIRFEELCMRVQKFYVDLARYRRAIRMPISENYEEFVQKIDWYNAKDPIIKAAAAIRKGEALSSAEVQCAVNASASSHYAHALMLSMQYILSANHYLINPEVDMMWLKDRLDLGKLGINGLAV